MSVRDLAIVLALVLALPALGVIVRDAVAAAERGARPLARGLHVLWSALPVLLLLVLLVLSVRA